MAFRDYYKFIEDGTEKNIQDYTTDYAGCSSTNTKFYINNKRIAVTKYDSTVDVWNEEDKDLSNWYSEIPQSILLGTKPQNVSKYTTSYKGPQWTSHDNNSDDPDDYFYYTIKVDTTSKELQVQKCNSSFGPAGQLDRYTLTDHAGNNIIPKVIFVILQAAGGGGGGGTGASASFNSGSGGGAGGTASGILKMFKNDGTAVTWYVKLGRNGKGDFDRESTDANDSQLDDSTSSSLNGLYTGGGKKGQNRQVAERAGGAGGSASYHTGSGDNCLLYLGTNFTGGTGGKGGDGGTITEPASYGEVPANNTAYMTGRESDKNNYYNKYTVDRGNSYNVGSPEWIRGYYYPGGGGGGASFFGIGGKGGKGAADAESSTEQLDGYDAKYPGAGGGATSAPLLWPTTHGGHGGPAQLMIFWGYTTK